MSEPSCPPTSRKSTIIWMAVCLLGLVVLMAALTALVKYFQARDQELKAAATDPQPCAELLTAQRAELHEEAEWVEQRRGLLSIPIERAMAIVVEEIRDNPQAATPAASSSANAATTPPSSTASTRSGTRAAVVPSSTSAETGRAAAASPPVRPAGPPAPAVSPPTPATPSAIARDRAHSPSPPPSGSSRHAG